MYQEQRSMGAHRAAARLHQKRKTARKHARLAQQRKGNDAKAK
jgi:hypothetical protein